MKRMMQLMFATLIVSALALSSLAQAKKTQTKDEHKDHAAHAAKTEKTATKFLGKGDGVTTCPVTGEEITNKDVKADFYGRTVYFCCGGCDETAKKSPEAYIKKTHAEQVAAIKALPKSDAHGDHHADAKPAENKGGDAKFLGKGDGLETCPVTGEAVNKNLKHEADGQTFYVCCDGCADTVKKNPSLYLKKAAHK